ncbi:hypothetical protein LDENG_00154290 [Lucifuga dentata]|nr:hypothetical protein LDENG_00154290 [Lucifuga dentata]
MLDKVGLMSFNILICVRGQTDCSTGSIPTFKSLLTSNILKDHTIHFACLSLIYSVFMHITLLTIISQSILLEW